MTRFLIFLFLFSSVFQLNAKIIRSDTIIINRTAFLFVKCTGKSEINSMDTLLKVYRMENGARKYLLTQDIFTSGADCNSIFINHGTYQIKDDSLIFLTEFDFDQSKNFGLPSEEKQIYIVKDDGKMILIYDAEKYGEDDWRMKQ